MDAVEAFLREPTTGDGRTDLKRVPGLGAAGCRGLARPPHAILTLPHLVAQFLLLDSNVEAFEQFLVTKGELSAAAAYTVGVVVRRLADRLWQVR